MIKILKPVVAEPAGNQVPAGTSALSGSPALRKSLRGMPIPGSGTLTQGPYRRKLSLPVFWLIMALTAGITTSARENTTGSSEKGSPEQGKKAYTIFTGSGKEISYEKMVREISRGDILLFGELHNNPIAHWLQYEVTESLHRKRELVLGAEMVEADNQEPLNDYLGGRITAKALDTLARLWPNHKTDYAPLVDFARENGLRFIATNIPRRYANLVFKKDFPALDSLTTQEKGWMAPLPIEYDPALPGYAAMTGMMGNHTSETLPKAQAIKDATMAHFITANHPGGKLFIHFHGTYHSDNYEGILWYLKRTRPQLRAVTIATVSQADARKLDRENLRKADFILCVDENMTTTY